MIKNNVYKKIIVNIYNKNKYFIKMSSPTVKPSKLFVLTGYLRIEKEKFNREIHNSGLTPEDRNEINEEGDTYYSQEELSLMKQKLKIAVCSVCYEKMTHSKEFNVCLTCHNKHHVECRVNNQCPLCRGTNMQKCSNIYDILIIDFDP
jgi:hypothetical protein